MYTFDQGVGFMNTRLQQAIFETGYKKIFIAEQTNIEPTRFSRIINDRISPTPQEKMRLAEFLGRSTQELFPNKAVMNA
jgi:transcriptional regulator with XRE-family HTH domain